MENQNHSGHKYKDTVLRLLYQNPARVIELYNALENKNYKPTAKVTHFDIENKLLGRFGDIFCTIEDELLLLSEHMSSDNQNMPLRMLEYAFDGIMAKILQGKSVHKDWIKLPTPKFYVLYNGKKLAKNLPKVMKLSDAFITPDENPSLEVVVNVIDIRYSTNGVILAKSPSLQGYSYVVHLIEDYKKQGFTRDKAIAKAINKAINEQIYIADFLEENYRGVIDMFGYEYSLEEEMLGREIVAREEGRQEGTDEQALKAITNLLDIGMESKKIAQILERPLQWVENLISQNRSD
ncbi:MAG: hypothetical protein FWG64_12650 [Firmicutes bacterium]|nr:hypothetical protein [Bacillota bacterium]